jgi:hypothetical protein
MLKIKDFRALSDSTRNDSALAAQSDEDEHGAASEREDQCDREIVEHVAVR